MASRRAVDGPGPLRFATRSAADVGTARAARPALTRAGSDRVDVPVLDRDAALGRLDTVPVLAPPSHPATAFLEFSVGGGDCVLA